VAGRESDLRKNMAKPLHIKKITERPGYIEVVMQERRAPATALPGKTAVAVDNALKISKTLEDPYFRQAGMKMQLQKRDIENLKAIRAFSALEKYGFIEHRGDEIYFTGLTTLSETAEQYRRNERGAQK
jgi:hypothetical protein